MNAVIVRSLGGPDVLRLESVETPRPRTGSALVRVEAIGVNFIDTYHRTGLYPMELPFTPGLEGAGVIEALGADEDARSHAESHGPLRGRSRGVVRRDWLLRGVRTGAAAPPRKAPRRRRHGSRRGADAAGYDCSLSCHSTPIRYPPSTRILMSMPPQAELVCLLTQIAKMKWRICFWHRFDRGESASCHPTRAVTELSAILKRISPTLFVDETHGAGVDVVYDSVGRSTIMSQHGLPAPNRGMLVSFGQSSGKIDPIDPAIFARKGSLFFTRPSLMHYVAARRGAAASSWGGPCVGRR